MRRHAEALRVMTAPRASAIEDRNALKTAFKQVVVMLGGLEAAASCTRVAKSQLSEYGSVQADERHAPIDVVLDLERIAGEPLITAALARAQGCLLLPVELVGDNDIARALQLVATDAGRTLADAMRALSGDMGEAERRTLQIDLGDLVRAANAALSIITRPPTVVPLQASGERDA